MEQAATAVRCQQHHRCLRLDGGRHRSGSDRATVPVGLSGACARGSSSFTKTVSKFRERVSDGDVFLVNAEQCVGEIVNTLGVGPFEGYYRNEEAMRHSPTRHGWYWSGDLGYVDEDGWVSPAGPNVRLAPCRRRELPAGAPIEAIMNRRHLDVMLGVGLRCS